MSSLNLDPSGIFRRCIRCHARYELSGEEERDAVYTPICTDCLQRRCESNQPKVKIPDLLLGEAN